MKILYAANNNHQSKIQLERFIKNINQKNIIVKYAGYKNFLPKCEIDWTLNFLLKDNNYLFNNNRCLDLYQEQISSFAPDLIISDLEIYTSIVAKKLNIKLWHVSNQLLNFSLHHLYKDYTYYNKYYKIFYKKYDVFKKIKELIDFADKNYIYSHFGDVLDAPVIDTKYSWVRPYYVSGKLSVPCQHDYVGIDNDKKEIISFLSQQKDSVLFAEAPFNNKKIYTKNINNLEEYSCNLVNCKNFVCDGTASYLADAFYNQKNKIIIPNYSEKDNMFNYMLYKNIYNYTTNKNIIHPMQMNIKDDIKYIHQEIEDNL